MRKHGKYSQVHVVDNNSWLSTQSYISIGLLLTNAGTTVKIPNGVKGFSVGTLCASTTFDLADCSNLKSLYLGACAGKFIFPSSLEALRVETGRPSYDFSRCLSLENVMLLGGGNDDWAKTSFGSLPAENKLNYIQLKRCDISNLKFLSGFETTELKSLIIGGWSNTEYVLKNFVSLDGIQSATGLTSLWIRYTYLNDLKGLESLSELLTLDLQYNRLDYNSNISNISSCVKLTSLDLSNNQVNSVDFMSNLVNLQKAYLSNNLFSSLPSDLAKLTNLEILDISGCKSLTELRGLETLIQISSGKTALRTLKLDNCSLLEEINSSTGFNNRDILDKLKNAGCSSITKSGTRL